MPQRQTFISNFLAAMDSVTPLIATQRYAAVVNGTGNTTVYAFGECMKDLTTVIFALLNERLRFLGVYHFKEPFVVARSSMMGVI